jgi:hypothetical protein
MTPVVLWVERLPGGPPKLVTFLPAFWLLVPGAGYGRLARAFALEARR